MSENTWRAQLGVLGIGHSVNTICQWMFEDVLYPWVILKEGSFVGGAMMTALAFIYCLITIAFYNWSKKDWLGIEMVKGSGMGQNSHWLISGFRFVLLSVYDPFIATVWVRDGVGQYQKLSRKDWFVFITSFAIANTAWIAITSLAVEWENEFALVVIALTLISIIMPVVIARATRLEEPGANH